MEEEIRQDLLAILRETLASLEKEDYASLKEISDHTIHNASIFQDQDSLSIAVLVYALYKIISKVHEKNICETVKTSLHQAEENLQNNNIEKYQEIIRTLFKIVAETDDRLHLYIQEVVDGAQIKKGSKLFEHGLSLARAAELLGISRWELMQYVGKTRLAEQIVGKIDVRDRVRFARRIFGV